MGEQTAGHMPGPWKAQWIPGEDLGFYRLEGVKSFNIDTALANARLISAAPDYRAAALFAKESGTSLVVGILISHKAYNALMAALAKTEG